MNVVVNGLERTVPDALTIEALLQSLDLGAARVAVEVNGSVVARRDHGRTVLRDHDRVEVVQFVGGG